MYDQKLSFIDVFLKKYGGDQTKAYSAIHEATQQHVKSKGINGVFEEVVNVNGKQITVRGNVNDEVKIGDAFIPYHPGLVLALCG